MASCITSEYRASCLVADCDALVGLHFWFGAVQLVEGAATCHCSTGFCFDEWADQGLIIGRGDRVELNLRRDVNEFFLQVFKRNIGQVGVELGSRTHAGGTVREVFSERFGVGLCRRLHTTSREFPFVDVDAGDTEGCQFASTAICWNTEHEGPAIGGLQLANLGSQFTTAMTRFGFVTVGCDHDQERNVWISCVWNRFQEFDRFESCCDHRRTTSISRVARQRLQNMYVRVDHDAADRWARTFTDGEVGNDGVLVGIFCCDLDSFQLSIEVLHCRLGEAAHRARIVCDEGQIVLHWINLSKIVNRKNVCCFIATVYL